MKVLSSIVLAALFVSSLANAATKIDPAKARYNSLPGIEQQLMRTSGNAPLVGANVDQKDDNNGSFCRKTIVVAPHAKPIYACYDAVVGGSEAQAIYESQPGEIGVMFYSQGEPRLGTGWSEKEVSVPRYGEKPLLCVRRSAVVPHPVPGFECYMTGRPLVGGAVSVGN